MNPKQALLTRRKQLIQQLPSLSEVIRGSLIERRLRCGKLNCHCVKGEGHHIWYLTVSFARGRTEQITLPEEYVPYVKEWLKNYDHWWISLEEVSAINRELLRRRWLDCKPPPKPLR
jgi:Family of unknown function (DUF6788)